MIVMIYMNMNFSLHSIVSTMIYNDKFVMIMKNFNSIQNVFQFFEQIFFNILNKFLIQVVIMTLMKMMINPIMMINI